MTRAPVFGCLLLAVACGPGAGDTAVTSGSSRDVPRAPASAAPIAPDLPDAAPPPAPSPPAATGAATIGGARPVSLHVPPSYDGSQAVPLVVMLHGYGASGAIEEAYLDLTRQADTYGFLYAYPDGTVDAAGNRFWNATSSCCDFFASGVDDAGYLREVILSIEARYRVAPRRVFVVGHSNGAFMAYRMACDSADLVGGVVSLAGAMWDDVTFCAPSAPVSVLEIHGTDDPLVPFGGGFLEGRPVPATRTSVADWVGFNACDAAPDTSAPPLDLDSSIPGRETTITRFGACGGAVDTQLWTVVGGGHVPALSGSFGATVARHLLGLQGT